MTLYLFNFNNYYNRIVKKFDTIADYENNGTLLAVFENINFNLNDGIDAEQILNYSGDMPDYLIVVEDDVIHSRWFVLESSRTRSQQFRVHLYRDVVVDWYDEIIQAPSFIEKATAQIGDPAIFNNEDMTFNQIKTKETFLKDKTKCPWIVGYVDRSWTGTAQEPISIPTSSILPDYELTSLDDYEYYAFNSTGFNGVADDVRYRLNSHAGSTGWVFAWDKNGDFMPPLDPSVKTGVVDNLLYRREDGFGYAYIAASEDTVKLPDVYEAISELNWNINLAAYTDKVHTSSQLATFLEEDGKIIKVGDTYYKIGITDAGPSYEMFKIERNGSALNLLMNNAASIIDNQGFIDLSSIKDEPYQLEIKVNKYNISFFNVIIGNASLIIPQDRDSLIDAPYDMFCIPFSDNLQIKNASDPNAKRNTVSKAYGFKLAQELITRLGKNLYDIQLLPYCPLPDSVVESSLGDSAIIDIDGKYDVDYLLETKPVSSGSNVMVDYRRSAVIWCRESSFSKILTNYIRVSSNNIEFKIENECDMYRLVSPNYSGGFEFSATKNNGVSGFRVDCTYKPISPYIHVAPQFDGLYGKIRDDARGLICSGDFSLTQWTDQWIQYQLNNKNYNVAFDRQIENIEVNNSIQRTMEKWNVATGALGGATTGALIGGNFGPAGAAVGGIVSGTLSAAGGLADIYYNEKLRQEVLDYTKDQFGYQLQNIKALPNSLTKISAFNVNNKIFPILEYYTCTDIEKDALRNKIKYNGMTIMRIAKIADFILLEEKSYIKSRLIRLETIADDFHIVNTISNELFKGVFI